MIPPDLQSQMLRMLDSELSEGELAALEAELLGNPEARKVWMKLARLHSALEVKYESEDKVLRMSVVPINRVLARQRRRVAKISFLASAAVLVLSALLLWIKSVSTQPMTLSRFQAAPNSVLTISHAGGGSAGNALAAGSRMVLKHGVVELELPHKVRAILEAPTSIHLVDERTLELDYGRGLFEVVSAEGRGFTVVTPHQRIVDLGTAFGIDLLRSSEELELHVLEGKVRVDGLGGEQGKVIDAGRSVVLAGIEIKRELDGPLAAFRRELPTRVETLLLEDFESGLLGGRYYIVRMDPNVVTDLAGNSFRGLGDDNYWGFETAVRAPAGHVLASFNFGGNSPMVTGDVAADHNRHGLQFWGTTGIWANLTANAPSATNRGITLGLDPANGLGNTQGNRGPLGSSALRIYPQITSGDVTWKATGLTPHAFYDLIWYNKRVFPGENRHPNIGINGFDAGNGVGASAPLDEDRDQNFVGVQADATGSISGTWFLSGGEDSITAVAGVQVGVSSVPNNFAPSVVEVRRAARGDDLLVSFSEPVQRGKGDLLVRDASRDGVLESIPISSDRVHIRGGILRISDVSPLGAGGALEISAGAVIDLEGNPFSPGSRRAGGWPIAAHDAPEERSTIDRADDAGPLLVALRPAGRTDEVVPGGRLEMVFDKPIKLGKGRIYLRNVTDWVESKLAVGDPRIVVEGNTLILTPPADLKDGATNTGWVGDWSCDHSAGLLNPKGDGSRYRHRDLKDSAQSHGVIGSMSGPVMATFSYPHHHSRIRHELGPIAPASRYAVSVAIGVREDAAAFLGYTIRLSSGDTILAELSEDTPPGPSNSVSTVGLRWDSSILPEGISPGDPLAIEIAPQRIENVNAGYLDLDHVRVTVTGG